MSSFGKILKRIRSNKGLPQREAARRIGMDHARFSRLENDRTGFNPTRETVLKIAQALEVDEIERGELLEAAGRLDQEIEALARTASKRPALAKLLRIAAQLSSEQLEELLNNAEAIFMESKEIITKGKTIVERKSKASNRKIRSNF